MAHALYMDHCANGAVVAGLRRRGVDLITAEEDGRRETADPLVLDRATELRRVVFTEDRDFLREARRRQQLGFHFHGVIYARPNHVPIGRCIEDIHIIVESEDIENLIGNVIHLPL